MVIHIPTNKGRNRVVIEKDTDYVVELNREMFDPDYTEANSYESFMKALIAHFKLNKHDDLTGIIQYPGGTHSAISNFYTQATSQDILLIDLSAHVWKHRYTFILRALTTEGVQHIRKIINKTKSTKTLMDVNQEISLVIH